MKNVFDYRRLLLPPTTTLHRAIEVMTAAGTDIVLVAGKNDRLLGIIVDSDIRKAILKGKSLATKLSEVMNRQPVTLAHDTPPAEVERLFQASPRANVPLVDSSGRVRGLAQMSRYLTAKRELANWVVLLVGGQGRRLHPLTENQPKPMLPVGDKPILETIVEQFVASGFRNIIMAINHQAAQIRGHFGDGRRLGANIRYVQERQKLGTAGPLSLLARRFSEPLLVMNGDLLTRVDFRALLKFHEEEKSSATVCVREYDFQVPYGVIHMDDHRLRAIVEKPTHRFFVNAGIYVLAPKALAQIPKGRRYDMPELLQKLTRRQPGSVGCFPIREYWIDIGQLRDYERAQVEYGKFFPA